MQQYYRILMIVAAVALVGAGVLIAEAFTATPPPPPPVLQQAPAAIPSSSVLVAKTDLKGGQFLQESDFTWRERPTNSLRPDLYVKGADSTSMLMGAVLLRMVHEGEAIQRGDVVSPRDRGFLAAVLAPDKRSISVAVDDVTGNAGLILPGDRVDVLVTHTAGQSENPARQVVGQVVLEDLRVIAVDQALRGPTEEIKVDPAKEDKRGLHPEMHGAAGARTITLEVEPQEAEMLAVATNLGKLTLVLRSLTHSQEATGNSNYHPIWAGDVMHSLSEMGGAPSPAPAPVASAEATSTLSLGVVVIRGGGTQK